MPTTNNFAPQGQSPVLKDPQQRVVARIQRSDQPGLVVAHGTGVGKTLTSMAAATALGGNATVVVPAALQANYHKEILKHHYNPNRFQVSSMQAVARRGYMDPSNTLIIDEAHRLRNAGGKTEQAIRNSHANKRLLLTGSPFYNNPAEIAPLVNIAAGRNVLPSNQADFMKKYVVERKVRPGVLAAVFGGVKPGVVPDVNPRESAGLKKVLNKWVDYQEGGTDEFPGVDEQTVNVDMTKKQQNVYDSVMGRAPSWVRYKVMKGLPPSKSESKDMNAFLTAARQVSTSTRGFDMKAKTWEEPKIDEAFHRLQDKMNANPNNKSVVYSNYLESGLNPYRDRLIKANIPFGEYTGQMKKVDRDQLVKDYNSGTKKVILMSSAGGEGLDLKGTRQLQILEPHFNDEKLKQVIGRAVRYRSHADLPTDQQRVSVERYIATRGKNRLTDKLGLTNPGKGTDEYLQMMSRQKEDLNSKFRSLLKDNSNN